MHARRPKAASVKAGIPTLGALIAAGAQLVGCVEPMCAGNRVAELDTHGRTAAQRAQQGHPATALHELAIATGIVAHAPSSVAVASTPTVAPPIVVPVPPALEPELVPPQGGMPPATLEPVQPPPARRIPPSGGARSHTPTPPAPRAPRAVRTPPPDPLHQQVWEGDSARVGPLPLDDSPLAPIHREAHPLGLRRA